ncbi:transmembrane protein 14C-like [Centruroides vittatus]|uniref:transmembrane protein 14C-like n=1 Tax=Centruroides vittatus TaxID=120091 RepID=UPI00350F93AD
MGVDVFIAGYAATVAVGGVVGYFRAKSKTSLASGLIFGGILGYGCYQISEDPDDYSLTLATSLVLAGVMGSRYYKTKRFMPAGLITTISLGVVARYGIPLIVKNLQ